MLLPLLLLLGGGYVIWTLGQRRVPMQTLPAPVHPLPPAQQFFPTIPGLAPGVVTQAPVPQIPSGLGLGVVTTQRDNLIMRAMPNVQSQAIDSIPSGSPVAILNAQTFGWYQIFYNGKVGYVSKDFVQQTTPLIPSV